MIVLKPDLTLSQTHLSFLTQFPYRVAFFLYRGCGNNKGEGVYEKYSINSYPYRQKKKSCVVAARGPYVFVGYTPYVTQEMVDTRSRLWQFTLWLVIS